MTGSERQLSRCTTIQYEVCELASLEKAMFCAPLPEHHSNHTIRPIGLMLGLAFSKTRQDQIHGTELKYRLIYFSHLRVIEAIYLKKTRW